ncbi:MAG: dioxygenase [Sphingomonadales bacterium]|nr:dioxygenase [Sphingomonadales bacterium]
MTQRLPALFLGHGSPMTIITDNPELRAMAALGQRLPRPTAVLCISAHYETRGRTHLTVGSHPKTIHDFRGFPPELYEVRYPAPGDDALVDRIAGLLGEDRVHRDSQWGFDHGVYGVLLPLLGQADTPTVAMSLDRALTPGQHLATARALAPLRDEGVLIVASGNVIHNLALWRQSQGTRPDWALDFRARTNAAILAADDEALTHFAPDDRAASTAINSAEHYLPLLYAVGVRLPGDGITLFNDTLDGALSMTSVLYGDARLLA